MLVDGKNFTELSLVRDRPPTSKKVLYARVTYTYTNRRRPGKIMGGLYRSTARTGERGELTRVAQ